MVFKASPSRPGGNRFWVSRAPGPPCLWRLESSLGECCTAIWRDAWVKTRGARGESGAVARGTCAPQVPAATSLTRAQTQRERAAGQQHLESSVVTRCSIYRFSSNPVAPAPSPPIDLHLLPLLQQIRADSLHSCTQELLVLLRCAHLHLPAGTPSLSCITGTPVPLPLPFLPSAQLLLLMLECKAACAAHSLVCGVDALLCSRCCLLLGFCGVFVCACLLPDAWVRCLYVHVCAASILDEGAA